jgi:hypothetical protein
LDASHVWGGDLALAPGGDLLAVEGTAEGQQRVMRRVLTLPGNYIWQPEYGAGAPAMIGSTKTPKEVEGALRAQLLQEAAVAPNPPPVVQAIPIPNGQSVKIEWVDQFTGEPAVLAFNAT